MITILAGGSGSVKLVRGFASHESNINVITNVEIIIGFMECIFVLTLIPLLTD